MKKIIILAVLLSSGCGGHYDAKVSGDVYVHHQIEVQDLNKYFYAECEVDNPSDTPAQLQTCADAKVGQVLSFLFGATK